MSLLKTSVPIQIHFSEVDTLQIVWHGHYLKYFEFARETFALAFGIDYLAAKNNGYALPVTNITTDYKWPLKYGDKAKILVEFVPQDAAKIVYRYTITNQENKVICKAESTQVFTALDSNELQLVFPEYFKKALKIMLNNA
jgi:acyl-CoA thioester hydrolase